MNQVMSCMLERRSVRGYTQEKVSEDAIRQVLTAACWAPSGNNRQPWKFSVVMNDKALINELSSLTIFHKWVETAPCLIAVFLDTKTLDNKIQNCHLKHTQSIGAAIQNMLLMAHQLGLSTCWIGEILKNETKVRSLLGASNDLQLMAVISIGYASKDNQTSKRKDLSENIISWL